MNDRSNPADRGETNPVRSGALARWRFLGFLLASLVTLLALAWAVENWRGARAWSAVKRDLVARGEPLAIEQLVPPQPPDEQNFAATPLLRGLLDYDRGLRSDYDRAQRGGPQSFWRDPQAQVRMNAICLPPTRVPPGEQSSKLRHPQTDRSGGQDQVDLMSYALGMRLRQRKCPPNLDPALGERYGYLLPGEHWKKRTYEVQIAASITDPAQEILEYLHRFDPELQEIADAVRRPKSQFPVHWDEGYLALLPHLAPLKQLSTIFWVRAAARLHQHDTAGALVDTLTCVRLAQSVQTEPCLISQLVMIGQHAIGLRAVCQGLLTHQWSADQVAALQAELGRFNFQQQMLYAVRAERLMQNRFLDQLRLGSRSQIDSIGTSEPPSGALLLVPWVPGWVHQNQARLNRYDNLALQQLTDSRWPANIVGGLDHEAAVRSAGLGEDSVYTVLAHVMGPDFEKTQAKAARAETLNRLAMVACALERFRSEHGEYPKALSDLTPNDLSGSSIQDPMSGAPLRYERTVEATAGSALGFRLWSVGMNGRDDGGVALEKDNDAQGDWVWPLPISR